MQSGVVAGAGAALGWAQRQFPSWPERAGVLMVGFFFPALTWWVYVVLGPALLARRVTEYRERRWLGFVADWCYAVAAGVWASAWVEHRAGRGVLGALHWAARTSSPLAALIWRNRWDVSSLDRMSSVFLHLAPGIFSYARDVELDTAWGTLLIAYVMWAVAFAIALPLLRRGGHTDSVEWLGHPAVLYALGHAAFALVSPVALTAFGPLWLCAVAFLLDAPTEGPAVPVLPAPEVAGEGRSPRTCDQTAFDLAME